MIKFILKIIFSFLIGFSLLILYAWLPYRTSRTFSLAGINAYREETPAPNTPDSLTVLTYNIGYASGKKNNMGRILESAEVRSNLVEIAKQIQSLNPDIVALQEVDFDCDRTFHINQMDFLRQTLSYPYSAHVVLWNKKYIPWPYWPPSLHFGSMLSGQVVLSRYPITEQSIKLYDKPSENPFWYNWFYLNRAEQKVQIQLGEKSLSLWNVHLEAYQEKTRVLQATDLGNSFEIDTAPYKIALGDFNSSSFADRSNNDQSDSHWALDIFYKTTVAMNAEDPDTPIYTFPSWDPKRKIDHVFYNRNFEKNDAGVIPGPPASDHLPVWATLNFKEFKTGSN